MLLYQYTTRNYCLCPPLYKSNVPFNPTETARALCVVGFASLPLCLSDRQRDSETARQRGTYKVRLAIYYRYICPKGSVQGRRAASCVVGFGPATQERTKGERKKEGQRGRIILRPASGSKAAPEGAKAALWAYIVG